MSEHGSDDRVVELGVEPVSEPVPVPQPTSRIHSFGVGLTATCGFVGLISALAFVTVGWSGTSRRVMLAVFLFAIVGLVTGVTVTILGAARDTYARKRDN